DKALVESWKGDMDGILFFSGLFSAVVTAFLIESYKFLQIDNSATTVMLLARTVAVLENAPVSTIDAPVNTNPSIVISLYINCVWFLSLILSLNCALLATLIQQWAREYSQIVSDDQHMSKLRQASIRAYVAEGVEKFGVSTIVTWVPILLHNGLMLFFAGLVAFLFTIHSTLAYLILSVLALTALVYTALTLLPAFVYNCPYRTPFS
ncbi:hypothetical protein K488DRAFT_10302, partial [Vararia minispora EC-137]